MGPTRAQKVRLGIFMLVGVGLIVGFILVLSGVSGFAPENRYTLRYTGSISGLRESSSVRVNGVRVGGVREIRLDPDNIEEVIVEIAVDPDVPVKANAKAYLVNAGITGGKFIELRGGTQDAAVLPPGSEIPTRKTFLQQVMSGEGPTGDIMEDLKHVSKIMRGEAEVDPATGAPKGLLGDMQLLMRNLAVLSKTLAETIEENRATIKTTGDNVATITATADDTLKTSGAEFNNTMRSLQRTLATTNQAIERARVDKTLREIDATLGVVRTKIEGADLDGAISDLRRGLDQLVILVANVNDLLSNSSHDVRIILTNMRDTSENLAIFSRTIRDDPSVLLTGTDIEPRAE